MKIATKALASLLIIAMLSLTTISPATAGAESVTRQRGDKKLEKVVQHHDRKFELRASVLGMSAIELREQLRTKPFESILRAHGFKNKDSYYTAVAGKVKDELKRRGWSEEKISKFMQKRMNRLAKLLPEKTAS